jgi:hypothetical protein
VNTFGPRILLACREVGRMRHALDRLADELETLALLAEPAASDRYRANVLECGDEELSVAAAIEDIDAYAEHVRRLLGTVKR